MKNNIFVGIDGSWRGFGMSLLNVRDREIRLFSKEFDYNKKEPYNVYYYTLPVNEFIKDTLLHYRIDDVHIAMEYHSTYAAYMQGELLSLDNLVIHNLLKLRFEYIKGLSLDLYYQTYIRYITQHKSSDKAFTIQFVEEIIEKLNSYGFIVTEKVTTKSKKYGERITDGEADSFIYLLRQLVIHKDKLPEDLKKFVCDLVIEHPRYLDVKELPWKF